MVKDGKGEFILCYLVMVCVFSDVGYNVLFLDSFILCGCCFICQDIVVQCEVSVMNCCFDVQVVLYWVILQLDVDVKCIVLLGWLYGVLILLVLINLVEIDVVVCKIQLCVVVVFYLDCCFYVKISEFFKLVVLFLILMGENDDWMLFQVCEVIEEKMKGSDIEIVLCFYFDIYYDFDVLGLLVYVCMDVVGVGKCGEGVISGGNLDVCSQVYCFMFNFLDVKLNY